MRDVEVGIDALYEMTVQQIHGAPQLLFMDDLRGTLDQMASYSRVVDEQGNQLDEIEDKSLFHFVDALRYLAVWLKRAGLAGFRATRDESAGDRPPAGVFAETPDPDPREEGRPYRIGRADRGGDNYGCPSVW